MTTDAITIEVMIRRGLRETSRRRVAEVAGISSARLRRLVENVDSVASLLAALNLEVRAR